MLKIKELLSKNSQNLLAMQSFINEYDGQTPSLEQMKTDQLANLSAIVDEQHRHFLDQYQNYNPYPQDKIDEAVSQMDEENPFVSLATTTNQLDAQTEVWSQFSRCSDFSAEDLMVMQNSAAVLMNLSENEKVQQMGYNSFDTAAASVTNCQSMLTNYQSNVKANYTNKQDALMQQALTASAQLTNLQTSLADPTAMMSGNGTGLSDLSSYEDQFADLAATQATLQGQLDQIMADNNLLEASQAMKNNVEMSVCGLALPPLLDIDFSLPSFSLGLPSINLIMLKEIGKLIESFLPSLPDISMPSLPDISMPSLPDISMPSLPDISTPSVNLNFLKNYIKYN
ncbi:hypothetical protein [Piscirickettsia litoralis]|uniref:Uncharacterized protein n=1 Tax=Piscirickettsia litoralis TaxID=1891921 RepID=A0ABX3A2N9_9GAMM|nr:hypothetical protein [Piscirickettsia litoralis]ODN41645.1 hypothetical protein BGC07_16255 [Piscirickettsia litoralis]